jgi:hypothetical protein
MEENTTMQDAKDEARQPVMLTREEWRRVERVLSAKSKGRGYEAGYAAGTLRRLQATPHGEAAMLKPAQADMVRIALEDE